MVSPSAICKVNGTTLATSGTTGINVSAGSTITIQLANTAGVNSWSVDCTSSDGINSNSSYTLIEATKSVNYSTFTATFTAPAMGTYDGYSVGAALQFTSVVNAGSYNANTVTFGVFVLNPNGLRSTFPGETLESDATFGVVPDLNGAGVSDVGLVGMAGG